MLEGSCIICKGDTLSSIETRTYKLACHHLILAVILGRVSRCPQSRRNPFRAREDFEPSELWWEILPSSLHSSNRFLWIFSKRRSISTTLLISYISFRIDFEISDKRNNNSRIPTPLSTNDRLGIFDERKRDYGRVSDYSDSINDTASHTVLFRYEEDVAKVGALWAILFSVTV